MIAFDDFPVLYFSLGYILAAAIVVLACWNKIEKQEPLFLLAAGLLVVLMRLPILMFNQEINPDESQMIAHAITLWQYPIYWQSVDGTTIGPLDIYALLFPSFFGLAFDYTSARLVGLLCVLGSLFFFYTSVKNFFNGSVARLSLLPALFLVTFAQNGDFVHYTSEQLPVFLLNLGLWLLTSLVSRDSGQLSYLFSTRGEVLWSFLLGFVLGMSPFAKIQVVPQAAIIGVFALIFTYQSPYFLKKWVALVVGSMVFPFLVVTWAIVYGVLDDFWDFYVLGNLIYAGGSSLLDSILRIPSFFAKSPEFLVFLGNIGSMALLALFKFRKMRNTNERKMMMMCFFAGLWLFAALYAATKSGNDFVHYLNLCIYPFALVGAFFIRHFIGNQRLVNFGVLFIILPYTLIFGKKVVEHQPINAYISTNDHRVPQSAVAKMILKHTQKGERLVVWGWMCKYHVETQMPQGATEAHFERCIYPQSMREKYYQRFLKDIKTNQPTVFVDAIGPNNLWLNDRTTQAHEAFSEINDFVQKNYTFVGEVESTRVYIRK